jgi:hypothetical protein
LKRQGNALFSENSVVPYFGAIWLALVTGFEIFFLLAPAYGGELFAKAFVLLLGSGFLYIGVWLIQRPSRYEIHYEDRHVVIRLVPLFGEGKEHRIRADQITGVTIDVSENSEGTEHHRVFIATSQGIIHDLLPSFTANRAEQARSVLAGLKANP